MEWKHLPLKLVAYPAAGAVKFVGTRGNHSLFFEPYAIHEWFKYYERVGNPYTAP